jgi:flagellar transcriptional activator FlhD
METNQVLDEIKEINLGYMLLAQQLVRDDKVSAIYRLGISQEMADIVEHLSPNQLLKMAASNMLLCRFRFDDQLVADMLTGHGKSHAVSQSHAAILMAGEPAEAVA